MRAAMQTQEAEDAATRGQALYEQHIRAVVDTPQNRGKMLVVNVETGEYEMDADDVRAAKEAKARFGTAALFSMRVGYAAAYRLGGCIRAGGAA